jgi:hypothetical protein
MTTIQVLGTGCRKCVSLKDNVEAALQQSGIQADVDLKGQNLRSLQRLILLDGLPEGPFQITFQLTRDGGGYRFRNIAGSLDAPAPLGRIAVTRGEASVSGDNALSAALEGGWRQVPAAVKLDLTGADPRTPGGRRGLEITATLGDTALSGNVHLEPRGARPKIIGDVSFTKIDLAGSLTGAKNSYSRAKSDSALLVHFSSISEAAAAAG